MKEIPLSVGKGRSASGIRNVYRRSNGWGVRVYKHGKSTKAGPFPTIEEASAFADSFRGKIVPSGKFAIVDDEDYDWAMQWGWSVHSAGYAYRGPGRRAVLLHRAIAERMGLNLSHDIDHKNQIPLDNRRCNLRSSTRSQNMANRPAPKTCTSGVKGVYWSKAAGKWMARITVDYKGIYLGTYDDINEAASAYREAAGRYFGEFAQC